jgi:ABC-type ATPase with predicted acetyltransferase domain
LAFASSATTVENSYHILSTGERFRADLARIAQRAAADGLPVIVDDFGSNLDPASDTLLYSFFSEILSACWPFPLKSQCWLTVSATARVAG